LQDRLYIVTRIFHFVLHKLSKDIVSKKLFDKGIFLNYWISRERSSPCSCFFWLEVKRKEAILVDYFCSEIADPLTKSKLFQSVDSHMMHDRCEEINPTWKVVITLTHIQSSWLKLLLLWKMEDLFIGVEGFLCLTTVGLPLTMIIISKLKFVTVLVHLSLCTYTKLRGHDRNILKSGKDIVEVI
jgi:hypothetical protein